MKRRTLLQMMSLGLVGAAVDVDKLLWVPGAKTYFLPPPSFLSVNEIARETLERLNKAIPHWRRDLMIATNGHRMGSVLGDGMMDLTGKTVGRQVIVTSIERYITTAPSVPSRIALPVYDFDADEMMEPCRTDPAAVISTDINVAADALIEQIKAHEPPKSRHDTGRGFALPYLPQGVEAAIAADKITGIAVRVVRAYDGKQKQWFIRYDTFGTTEYAPRGVLDA